MPIYLRLSVSEIGPVGIGIKRAKYIQKNKKADYLILKVLIRMFLESQLPEHCDFSKLWHV